MKVLANICWLLAGACATCAITQICGAIYFLAFWNIDQFLLCGKSGVESILAFMAAGYIGKALEKQKA